MASTLRARCVMDALDVAGMFAQPTSRTSAPPLMTATPSPPPRDTSVAGRSDADVRNTHNRSMEETGDRVHEAADGGHREDQDHHDEDDQAGPTCGGALWPALTRRPRDPGSRIVRRARQAGTEAR